MSNVSEWIVAQPEELAPCVEHLATTPVIGFDTEFVGEDTYTPQLCMIQVATAERLYLIDPMAVPDLATFWQVLLDPAKVLVVHAGREEVRICRHHGGRVPENLFDIQIAAGLIGRPYPLSHGALVQQMIGVQLPKGETLTEWRRRPLTDNQIRYAYDDVRCLLAVHAKIDQELARSGRQDWAREEFDRLKNAAAPVEPSNEKWRKLRSLGSLDRKRLAVVRALFEWREAQAAATNRPARSLIRDDLIVEIAKRGQVQVSDLQSIRGLARRDLEAIARVVETTRALPSDQWPAAGGREQDPPQVALLANLLGAVLADLCLRRQLANNLVASAFDVKALVRAHLQDPGAAEESQLTRGWRSQYLLPDLQAILTGQTALRVADLKAEAPLDYIRGMRDEG